MHPISRAQSALPRCTRTRFDYASASKRRSAISYRQVDARAPRAVPARTNPHLPARPPNPRQVEGERERETRDTHAESARSTTGSAPAHGEPFICAIGAGYGMPYEAAVRAGEDFDLGVGVSKGCGRGGVE